MSLARQVAWNTLVQVSGRAIGLVASLAMNAILIRHLEIATFGQFVAASTYVGLFMILGEAGLYLVTVRRAMQDAARRSDILGTALGIRMLWTIVPLALASVIAQWIPESRYPTYEPAVKLTIGILAINEYVRLLCQFLTAIFRMHLRMDLAVIGEVGSRILALVGILVVAGNQGGLQSVALALLVANGANMVYAWIVSRRLEPFRPQLDVALASQIIREAIVVAGVLVMSLLRTQIGTLLLSLQRSAEEVGVYGVAIKIHEVAITFPGIFIALLFPVLSRLATENQEKFRRLWQQAFDVMLLSSVGLGLVLIVLAPQVAGILGEPRAAAPLRLLACALPSVFVGMGFSHLALADGRQALVLRLYTVLALVTFGANLLLIPRFSYWSVASVTVGMEALVVMSLGTYWIRMRGIHLRIRSLWSVPVAVVLGFLLLRAGQTVLGPEDPSIPRRLGIVAVGGLVTLGTYTLAVLRLKLLAPEVLRALFPTADRTPGSSSPE